MGVLDKLMFWKRDDDQLVVDPDFEVNGCFTLPADDGTTGELTDQLDSSEEC